MLRRKATEQLKHWIEHKDRKCLVVEGARQTGKTYIIERFGEEKYEEIVEINFNYTNPQDFLPIPIFFHQQKRLF